MLLRTSASRWVMGALFLFGGSAAISCAEATGTVTSSGFIFDTDPPPCIQPVGDAATLPHTWSSLYADFFGPKDKAKASCTYESDCHGKNNDGSEQSGTKSSKGFVCS